MDLLARGSSAGQVRARARHRRPRRDIKPFHRMRPVEHLIRLRQPEYHNMGLPQLVQGASQRSGCPTPIKRCLQIGQVRDFLPRLN